MSVSDMSLPETRRISLSGDNEAVSVCRWTVGHTDDTMLIIRVSISTHNLIIDLFYTITKPGHTISKRRLWSGGKS